MGKIKSIKNKIVNNVEDKSEIPLKRSSDTPIPKKEKWINKQRILVLATRGINHRDRHLMEDIKTLMPHHKSESKMERSKNLVVVNEMCEMKNCNKAILFEGRGKRDLYMWMSNVPTGPSVKFLIENVYTMGELKLIGNCLRGSRPLLSFDSQFIEKPHLILLKEVLTQIFGVPNHHPQSQPFVDHVFTFTYLDNRIWFRNYQILSEDGALSEIGPRFVLNPVKIFGGSFGGETIWENSAYVSPAKYRQSINKKANLKYVNRVEQKVAYQASRPTRSYDLNNLDEVFTSDPNAMAEEIVQGKKDDDMQIDSTHKINEIVKSNGAKLSKLKKKHLKKGKKKPKF